MPRAFSNEFRQRAVDLVLDEGIPVRVAANQLGISVGGLDRWVRQARIDRGSSTDSRSSKIDYSAEVQQLKKEIRRLKEELEITRKAAALFARDSVFPK